MSNGDHFCAKGDPKAIRDWHTKPPNDFGDDISTEIAIQCNELSSRIRELEAELKHCQESEGWSKMMAMEGKIESLEEELERANDGIGYWTKQCSDLVAQIELVNLECSALRDGIVDYNELEADEEFHICKNNEYVERIAELEAEIDAAMVFVDKWLSGNQLKESPANRANSAREVALQAIEKLEAERDKLRARHAALVEKLEHDLHDMLCVIASYKLKAALAEELIAEELSKK